MLKISPPSLSFFLKSTLMVTAAARTGTLLGAAKLLKIIPQSADGFGVQGIMAPLTFFPASDDPRSGQGLHMMRQGALADGEFLEELTRAQFALLRK